jgi:hypothetical protein
MCGRCGVSSMTTVRPRGGLFDGGYQGARHATSSTRSVVAMNGSRREPRYNGCIFGKLPHTVPCVSMTGTPNASAKVTRARNASGLRPADSVRMIGFSAAPIRSASCSISSGGLIRRAGAATGILLRGTDQTSSSTSTGIFKYTGPRGVRCASSPARLTISYNVSTLPTWLAHLTIAPTRACVPPTIERFLYHCEPGSTPGRSP